MKDEYIDMPSLEEIKEELEGRYDLNLYARTIRDYPEDKGRHMLTQWNPIYVSVEWFASQPKGEEGYYLVIAKNEHSPVEYRTSMFKQDSLTDVINRIGGYVGKAKPKQIGLFE